MGLSTVVFHFALAIVTLDATGDGCDSAFSLCEPAAESNAVLLQTKNNEGEFGAPLDIANIVTGLMSAITEATEHFKQEPKTASTVTEGLTTLGIKLYDIFEDNFKGMVENETQNFDWDAFGSKFKKLFSDLASQMKDVQSKLDDFAENGSPSSLITAIGEVLDSVKNGTVPLVPDEVQEDVDTYFSLVTETVTNIGDAWGAFEDGKPEEGVEGIYNGMKTILDGALPPELQKDETYQSIMGVFDEQFGKLSDTVMKFKTKMTLKHVCYKRKAIDRPSSVAEQCPENTEFYEERRDKPSLPKKCKCIHKKRKDCPKVKPTRRLGVKWWEASCPADKELMKGRCYSACPDKHELVNKKKCKPLCPASHPESGGLRCGTSQSALSNAALQDSLAVITALGSAAANVYSTVKQGDDKSPDTAAKSFSHSLNAATDIAATLTYPTCPEP